MLTSGDVVDLELGVPEGREAGFRHPAVLVTAQRILEASPRVVHVIPLTSTIRPFHAEVVIDPDVTDSDGIPAPKMRYVIGENSRRMIDYHLERMSEAHLAAGAVSLDLIPVVRESGWHLLGTARMGTDPATSVVDQFCRSHDVPNLFVIDGSVFVTSTGVNPTATIMAIALRAMRHLAENRSNQVTAS